MSHLTLKPLILLSVFVGMAGCANPLNRVTHDRYWEAGDAATKSGQFQVAEQAYYRALVNVDIGNLGPLLKAQGLYNLGSTKIKLGKYAEAEDLLRQSLALDEKILNADDLDTDRCLVELAAAFAGQEKWTEGAPYLDKAVHHLSRFAGGEREFMLRLSTFYSEALTKASHEEKKNVSEPNRVAGSD